MALQSADGVLAAGGGPLPAAALDASADARASAQPPWIGTARELLTRPLPHAGFVDRCIQRGFSLWGIRQVRAIYGLENLRRAPRPCMVALNYSIKREALTVPALLDFHNDGRWIPFIGTGIS